MVSHDINRKWYKEDAIGEKKLESLLSFATAYDNFILQCPTMCPYVHKVNSKEHAIILMLRNTDDIIVSQKRIGWEMEKAELARYGLTKGIISKVKYENWFSRQRELIDNKFEVEYESLSNHTLWVPKEQRAGFKPRQTRLSSKFTWDYSGESRLQKKRREMQGRKI